MTHKLSKIIYNFIFAPFKHNFPILLLFFFFSGPPQIYFGAIDYSLYILFINFALCYFFVLPVYPLRCLNKYVSGIYISLTFIFIFFWYVVEAYCRYNLHQTFNPRLSSIVQGTNKQEIREFLYYQLDPLIPAGILLYSLLVLALFFSLKRFLYVKNNKISVIFILAVVMGVFGALRNPRCLTHTSIAKTIYLIEQHLPSLDDFNRNPRISLLDPDQPKNIVIIIGESFCSAHSSLYGYVKDTNPRLEELKDKSQLIVFSNSFCKQYHTIDAFKDFMSTYGSSGNQNKWYKCPSMPVVMKLAGYKTAWLSNQGGHGEFASIPTLYSELCDTSVFVGDKFDDWHRPFDEKLIAAVDDYIENNINKSNDRNLIFIHLIGSHFNFSERYPADFSRWSSDDYNDADPNKKEIISSYDNSIYYNDFVVSEIFKRFINTETILIYFSDHGIDLYESQDDSWGYALENDKASQLAASKIPMFVCVTDSFRNKYPSLVNDIIKRSDDPFCTSDLIYFVTEIAKVKIED